MAGGFEQGRSSVVSHFVSSVAVFVFSSGFPFLCVSTLNLLLTYSVSRVYELIYTGLGQLIAAYAPNAVFASLANPLILGTMISFCGVMVPYSQLQVFWRYWLYYLNPYTYFANALLTFGIFDVKVNCKESEYALFNTPGNQTCASYLADYMSPTGQGSRTFLQNPEATAGCRVCQYRHGSDYLATLNIKDYYYGWQDAGIVVLFMFSTYCFVFLLVKLRTKATKVAS